MTIRQDFFFNLAIEHAVFGLNGVQNAGGLVLLYVFKIHVGGGDGANFTFLFELHQALHGDINGILVRFLRLPVGVVQIYIIGTQSSETDFDFFHNSFRQQAALDMLVTHLEKRSSSIILPPQAAFGG